MKLFLLKSLMLASLMFMSVLAGMQIVNDGIHKMKGYSDPHFQSAVSLENKGNGSFNVSFLGQHVSANNLEEKQQQIEQMNDHNIFSSAGKNLSSGISEVSKKILRSIFGTK
ncbi:MAG: DUF3679 domain-containing protein [Bacillota bacterium]|nr:DUF3679 domain-containing protein [Bacillota bacterium]MDP4169568.1 DUF3679 domain-containing protein [Bacillota bacterium]